MTAQSAIPLKWYVPFANGDATRVELPVTTADPTRASQLLGFPPLTMQPPESGGVPPQGEDFNGGMNQIARVCWWILNGGGYPYDATFATNSNIGGYPNGAILQSADLLGEWINLADNNQNNPDTNGTNWVPGFQYGTTAVTGLTGGTVTLTPAQASKNGITLAGTLTSALTVILPTWVKNWTITNSTTGAFVSIVKTAAGAGVTIPQNGAPTRVSGDGTNIVQAAENVAAATQAPQPVQYAQLIAQAPVVGNSRNARMYVSAASASATFTADEVTTAVSLGGAVFTIANINLSINLATVGAGGMDTGTAPVSGFVALYVIYNPTTATAALLATNAATLQPNIYGGANLPSGYTASALVSVWPTNASKLLVLGFQQDRRVNVPFSSISPALTSTLTQFSIATLVPLNAKRVQGSLGVNMSSGGSLALYVAGGAVAGGNIGEMEVASSNLAAASSVAAPVPMTDMVIAQQIAIGYASTATFSSAAFYVQAYEI